MLRSASSCRLPSYWTPRIFEPFMLQTVLKKGSSPIQLEKRAPKFGSREIQLGLYLIEIAIGIGIGIELKSTLQQAAENLRGKDFIYLIRSLTPQQATGNALAIAVQHSRIPRTLPLRYNPCRPVD